MIKKIIAFAISASMLFAAVPAFAAGSAPSKWAAADVKAAIAKGVVPEGIQSDYQKPITREEFAELLVRSVIKNTNDHGQRIEWTLDTLLHLIKTDKEFTDTTSKYVKAAYLMGAIEGLSKTTFGPKKLITREQAATMIMNQTHYNNVVAYTDMDRTKVKDLKFVSKWAEPAVLNVVGESWMVGSNGNFDPKGTYTREQAISMMVRLMRSYTLTDVKARGEIPINPRYFNLFYRVSDNVVEIDYPVESEDPWADDPLNWDSTDFWRGKSITSDLKDPTTIQASIVYLFSRFDLHDRVVAKATYENRPIHVDYQYMTLDTLGKDYMMKFTLKDLPGYSTVIGKFAYGYPQKNVQTKITVK